MSRLHYHIFQTPMGWVGLLGTAKGLRLLCVQPTPEAALERLGPVLAPATDRPGRCAGLVLRPDGERPLRGGFSRLLRGYANHGFSVPTC